MADIQCWSLWS